MPELPEIETLRIQLSQKIIGLTIKDIEILKHKSFIGDFGYVTGEKITGIRRFAKMLVIDLSNGLSLAVHLKMSGQLVFQIKNQISNIKYSYKKFNRKGFESKEPTEYVIKVPNKHTRVIITFTNEDRLFSMI